MKFKLFDTVVLDTNLPAHGLQRGDIGAVVELYEQDGLEVEFVTGSGRTRALTTLQTTDVRPLSETDILSVRSSHAA